MRATPAFARADLRAGFRLTAPLAVGVATYGVAMGIVATTRPIGLAELLLMNVVVFAGSAQIVAVGLWASPVPVVAILLSTFVVNLRYLLMNAALRPVFEGRPLWQRLVGVHLVADENWATTLALHRRRPARPGHLLGGGLAVLVGWVGGTAVGYLVGDEVPAPERLGLDFAFTAAFVALALGFWRGRRDVAPWLTAGIAASLAWWWLPGSWYIVVGAVAGASAAAFGGEASEGGDDGTG